MDESKLKRCYTHAEAADDLFQKADGRELDDSETEVNNRKKQKQEEETTEKKKEECCYDTKGALGNNERTIFVTGFDASGSRDEIKSALTKHFSSCGELIRVFVPIECETGVSRGHAFLNMKRCGEIDSALTLNGSDLGGRKLLVTMAKRRREYHVRENFKGCETCRAILSAARRDFYRWKIRTNGGKFKRISPDTEEKFRLHFKGFKEKLASRKMGV